MGRQTRRDFLKTVGYVAVSATTLSTLSGCAGRGQIMGAAGKRPNIIFILADDLGYGDLGCYGQKQIQTPNIDNMAAEGIRFTRHYAGSTVSAPSRCVLMSGLHTGHCYVRGNKIVQPWGDLPLPADTVTVAKILKKAGYATGVVGKWGLGGPESTGIPNRQGFDYFFGYLNQVRAHNYYPAFLWRNQEKVELDNKVVFIEEGYARGIGSASTRRTQYSHDIFTEEAMQFIDRNKDGEFFLYLAYTIPHANNESHILDRHGMEVPDYGEYKDKDWPEPQKGYAAMITRMDHDVGRLLTRLKELGLDEDTLVMFSSDNGPHAEGDTDPHFFNSAGPLRGIKRDLYEGGIRVPMIARWPGRIKPALVTEHISASWDFLPSCAELAGAGTPENIDGISMVPTLLGRPMQQKKHEFLYWEFHEAGGRQAGLMDCWKAVRLNMHKNPNEPIELYNLENDIGEKHNVAEQHPQIVAKIEKYLRTQRSASKHFPMLKTAKRPGNKKARLLSTLN